VLVENPIQNAMPKNCLGRDVSADWSQNSLVLAETVDDFENVPLWHGLKGSTGLLNPQLR